MAYPFQINSTPFYASALPDWQAYGSPAFNADGQPVPYGPGAFSVVLNAVAQADPAYYAGDFGSSGTYIQLFNIWSLSLNASTDGVVIVQVFDPKENEYVGVKARMKPPVQMSGGQAVAGVTVEFYSAFISDEVRSGYSGGDPTPIDVPPPYIPGDPVPSGDPDLVGWNNGIWNEAIWNQEGA